MKSAFCLLALCAVVSSYSDKQEEISLSKPQIENVEAVIPFRLQYLISIIGVMQRRN